MNGVLLAMFQYWRNRTVLTETNMFVVFNFFALLVTLAFVLEDPHLGGIEMVLKSPNSMGVILFIGLSLYIKMHLKLIWSFYVAKSSETYQTYQNIEDRLFMEEYEDPKQQFTIAQFGAYKDISKNIEVAKLFAINQNLLKVHRSDSIDQTLDRINVQGNQTSIGRSNVTNESMINKFNLKLHDINKEIEYNSTSVSQKQTQNYTSLIWTSIILYSAIACYKLLNSIVGDKDK